MIESKQKATREGEMGYHKKKSRNINERASMYVC